MLIELRRFALVLSLTLAAGCSGGGGGGGGEKTDLRNLDVEYTSGSSVLLEWTNDAPDATAVQIERGLDSEGPFDILSSTEPAAATEYEDFGLEIGTRYWYRVRPIAGGVEGDPSRARSATPPEPPEAPVPVAGITVTPNSSTSMHVEWTHDGENVKGFRVERLMNFVGWGYEPVANLPADAREFDDTCIAPNAPYRYRITAYNDAGNVGVVESAANVMTPAATTAPAAAGAITLTQLNDDSYRVSWANPCSTGEYILVEHSINGGAFTNVLGSGYFGPDATYFDYVDLTPGVTYALRLRYETSAAGAGAYSPTANPTAPAAPPPAGGGSITIAADYDNTKAYSDLVESINTSAYPNGHLVVGCFWSMNTFLGIQNFICYSSAIHFPASAISALNGKTITSAYLVLGVSDIPINPTNINVYGITSTWNTSTLNGYQSLSLSGTGASVAISPSSYMYVRDVTGIVQGWANGTIPNNGIFLEDAEYVFPYDSLIRTSFFYSADDYGGNVANKPTLWIDYE